MATLFNERLLGQYKFGWGVGGGVTPADGWDVLKPVAPLQNDSVACPDSTLSEAH